MIKPFKTIVILIVAVSSFVLQSCLTHEDPDVRTEQMELQEIADTIHKLENAGYDIDTTDTGLYYIIHEQGTGLFPEEGDTCYVEYAAYFIDGVLLDTSQDHFPDGIWEMEYLAEKTIAGFYEGLGMMNKGTEADLLIPSKLAYGPLGTGGVPPYTPLIFSVKLHDLKKLPESSD